MEHARTHPGWNLLAGSRRAALVRGDEIVVVELASHLGHAVLVDEVRRRNAEMAREAGLDLGAREFSALPLRPAGVHRARA